jgi:PAS domain S-box-containing protein
MPDTKRTRAELVAELETLRQRVAELEPAVVENGKTRGGVSGGSLRRLEDGAEDTLQRMSGPGSREEKISASSTEIGDRERFRILVERNPHGIQEIDSHGTIIFANEKHHEIYGYQEGGLVGRSIVEFLVPGPQRDELPAYLKKLVRDQPPPSVYQQIIRRRDGEKRTVEVNWNYLRDVKGRVTGFISVLTDVTERERAEAEKRSLERQLQHAQKLESLGVLAGGIAHDFNNLLMAILGNAELASLALSRVSPARRSLEEIRKAGTRAADLCRRMLAYSGQGELEVRRLDMSELVSEMTHLLKSSISKNVSLITRLDPDLRAVEADAAQIQQVVMNLITNASEAIEENQSGVVTVSTGMMTCSREYLSTSYLDEKQPEGSYVYLEVADTGCGIDEQTRDRLFDPFFSTKFAGRGLGLSAMLGIIRGHRGAIMIESEVGVGTTFRVLFPAVAEEAQVSREPAAGKNEDAWLGSGCVLIVDDESSVCRAAARMVEQLGFDVLTAADGAEAIEVFAQHADDITCVLLDLTMPRMGGEETFLELRKMRQDIPVVLSSGYEKTELSRRFVGPGMPGFIRKPYMLAELRRTLRGVLEPNREEG